MTQVAPGPVRQKRAKMLRSKLHRQWVKCHQCVVCNRGRLAERPGIVSHTCHVNYLGAKHGKPRGMSERVDDFWTVPMCGWCHIQQSSDGQSGTFESDWWLVIQKIDPEPICLELARMSPDPAVRAAAADIEEGSGTVEKVPQ